MTDSWEMTVKRLMQRIKYSPNSSEEIELLKRKLKKAYFIADKLGNRALVSTTRVHLEGWNGDVMVAGEVQVTYIIERDGFLPTIEKWLERLKEMGA